MSASSVTFTLAGTEDIKATNVPGPVSGDGTYTALVCPEPGT